MSTPKIYGGKAITNKYVFRFIMKNGYSFRRFNCYTDMHVCQFWA